MADTVIMPKLGFDMAEGTLVRWVVAEGGKIAKGAVLAEIETDKATVEVESGFEGVVLSHLVKQGDIVPVNTPIALIGQPGEQVERGTAVQSESPTPSPEKSFIETPVQIAETPSVVVVLEPGIPGGVKASPLARRIAGEEGVNLRSIPGSGPGGRVIRKDVEAFLKTVAAVPQAEPVPVQVQPVSEKKVIPADIPALTGEVKPDEIVPMNRLRQAIGRRMVESKAPVPHFYITHEYNMDGVMSLRKQVNALLPDQEKLSVNDFIVKAVALSLRQFPNLNSSLRDGQVIRFGVVNIGVAVAVEGGLLTVVCRDADRKPVRQIGLEVRSMAAKAREGKVRPDDIEGSTFSISNLGMFDVENFIAIINPSEAAILAVGSAREVPVVENGEVKPGWRMKATISVDHRVSDGVEASQFLQSLARFLEQPLVLLI